MKNNNVEKTGKNNYDFIDKQKRITRSTKQKYKTIVRVLKKSFGR